MPAPALTCQLVDDQDLDTRYVAGGLADDVAEAFEQHYFGCDRCWELVHRGLEVRAASREASAPARAGGAASRARALPSWWPLAAAAGVTAIVLGTWRLTAPRPAAFPISALRGGADSLVVHSEATPSALAVHWAPFPGASAYRVRLYDAQGQLLLEREVADTAVGFARDSLRARAPVGPAYWDVVALDTLRSVIARSGAVPTVARGSPP
ncbi:MAG TPA: hypothetical protein VEU55_05550 [Gemmatimonadales bacterium]|nr:hypothetical protein [Gemmatimonadales bacterium]